MIRSVLAPAVLNSTGLTMIYGDEGWNNLFADEQLGEAVYLLGPSRFKITNMINLQENYRVQLLFLQKTQLDYTPLQQDTATLAPRLKLRDFVAYCRDADTIAKFDLVECQEVWNVFDCNASGWLLICDIIPTPTEPAC